MLEIIISTKSGSIFGKLQTPSRLSEAFSACSWGACLGSFSASETLESYCIYVLTYGYFLRKKQKENNQRKKAEGTKSSVKKPKLPITGGWNEGLCFQLYQGEEELRNYLKAICVSRNDGSCCTKREQAFAYN